MRKITLLLAALSFSLLADTRIYQCDMTVSQVKNDQISRPTKADFGALVVDSGDQFYVVRGDEVLSSPYLAKRNGKLVGVGEDELIYNKSHDVYGVHSKNQSFFFFLTIKQSQRIIYFQAIGRKLFFVQRRVIL